MTRLILCEWLLHVRACAHFFIIHRAEMLCLIFRTGFWKQGVSLCVVGSALVFGFIPSTRRVRHTDKHIHPFCSHTLGVGVGGKILDSTLWTSLVPPHTPLVKNSSHPHDTSWLHFPSPVPHTSSHHSSQPCPLSLCVSFKSKPASKGNNEIKKT